MSPLEVWRARLRKMRADAARRSQILVPADLYDRIVAEHGQQYADSAGLVRHDPQHPDK